MVDRLQASVIVLAWNGTRHLARCLDSVLDQEGARFEVVVVDNGSTDGSADLVAERYPQVQLIRNRRNLGFAAGSNVGLRAAAGETLVLLNQDTRVHPGWLSHLVQAFDDPSIGIAGCKLLYPDGSIQHAGGLIEGPRAETQHRGRHAPGSEFSEPADVEFVTGAALAIRREALDRIGLFDEGFSPAYYEDVDWCYRVRAAGWRVVYLPNAIATHFESSSTGDETYTRKVALNQGRLRFVLKHWPLHRLLAEFGPAEQAWVAGLDRGEEVMGARRAYLDALLGLPEIVALRPCDPKAETEPLLGLLIDLRAAAIASLEALAVRVVGPRPAAPDAGAEGALGRIRQLDELEAGQTLQERPFTSRLPVIGRLIVAVRTAWNNVSTKWYVRPIIQQQSALNAQMIGYLRILQDEVDYLVSHGVVVPDAVLRGQLEESAENVRELTALAERLARLEAELRRPDAAGREMGEAGQQAGSPR